MAITVLRSPSNHSFTKNTIPLALGSSLSDGWIDLVLEATIDGYSGSYQVIARQRLFLQTATGNIGRINLSSIFDNCFPDFELPDLASPAIDPVVKKIFKAKWTATEYSYVGVIGDTETGEFDIYRGGVPRQFEFYQPDPVEYIIDTYGWFTWKPNVTVVSKKQPEWLVLKTPIAMGGGNYDIKFVVKTVEGSTFNKTVSDSASGTSGTDIFFIPVGFNDNDLQTLIGAETALYYTVTAYLGGTATVIAETRTYILDHINRPFERFFMFTNSLGGIDVLRTIGEAFTKSNYEDEDVEINSGLSSLINYSDIKRINSIDDNIITINTGFRSKEENNWIRDFRRAVHLFEIDSTNLEVTYPIILVKKDLIPSSDNADLHALQFDYKYAYKNTVYAPKALI